MRRTGASALLLGLLVALLSGCSSTSTASIGDAAGSSRAAVHSTTGTRTAAARPSTVAQHIAGPCSGNAHGRLVLVSIRRQHLWMCHGTRVVHQSAVTTGRRGPYTGTPKGHFHIQALERNQTLTLADGQRFHVKYWIPFIAPLYGFHDSSWQKFPYGSPRYRSDGSHGCVHVPLKAIRTLYHWAHIGTRVTIR